MTKEKPVARLRAVKFIIQPVVVRDDGDSLEEVPVEPISIPASALADFPANFAAQLAAQNDPSA